ncbi:conserved hypothetical protein [Ricinus communis]|uniref:RNase H type-1 domain-containing protein n=1 Tax=Ricinus communis TaxID=3988 RepID=B9SF19_RICCO|nr:conserved hypothetical protein [Ricinus communis]
MQEDISFVVRDSVGNALLVGAKRVVMQCSSTVAEACSMRWALETIKACGIRILEVESDSKALVEGLNDNTCPELHEELLVQDTRAVAKDLDVKSFTFTRCSANKVAHKLAHYVHDSCMETLKTCSLTTTRELWGPA